MQMLSPYLAEVPSIISHLARHQSGPDARFLLHFQMQFSRACAWCYNISYFFLFYRYADRSYRTHPRGLIIYGQPTIVPSLAAGGNVSSTTILPILAKSLSNSSKSESVPVRNLVVGSGITRELPVANATSNATMPRCPLIPPNLGEWKNWWTRRSVGGFFKIQIIIRVSRNRNWNCCFTILPRLNPAAKNPGEQINMRILKIKFHF